MTSHPQPVKQVSGKLQKELNSGAALSEGTMRNKSASYSSEL